MQSQQHIPINTSLGASTTAATISQPSLMALSNILTLGPFKHRKDLMRETVLLKFTVLGYIAAGTYGKVYKAKMKDSKKDNLTRGTLGDNNSGIGVGVNGSNSVGSGLGGGSGSTLGSSAISGGGGIDVFSKLVGDRNASMSNSGPAGATIHTGTNRVENEGTKEEADDDDKQPDNKYFAIKKFKTDNHTTLKNYGHDINGNEIVHYTGISQSAIREMSLCRELNYKNIIKVIDIALENKSIYMIFEFCEHDLLQIIHFHSHPDNGKIPEFTIKSLIWQILNGVTYLHKNWIIHRDLKPANIMVSSNGVVKIGDLGLARKFNNPLQTLYTGDKVVVTIWYRAPELLLGTRHYTPLIDLWAIGCILAELLSLRPIFKGEEAKMDLNNKKAIPFQKNQLIKILEILGTPTTAQWPALTKYLEYPTFQLQIPQSYQPQLGNWYKLIGQQNKQCFNLLSRLLDYDPIQRLTADNSLLHPYFMELPKVSENAFEGITFRYPRRRIYPDDNDIASSAQQQSYKRHGFDANASARKRHR